MNRPRPARRPDRARSTPSTRTGGARPVRGGSGEQLVAIHDHLRQELAGLRASAAALAAGRQDVADVRTQVRDSQLRRSFTRFGAFCQTYCDLVGAHHGIEDAVMYPDLAAADRSLRPVLERLTADHVRIGGLLRALDDELARTRGAGATRAGAQRVAAALERLADALLVHLDVEERALVPALDRLRLPI